MYTGPDAGSAKVWIVVGPEDPGVVAVTGVDMSERTCVSESARLYTRTSSMRPCRKPLRAPVHPASASTPMNTGQFPYAKIVASVPTCACATPLSRTCQVAPVRRSVTYVHVLSGTAA